MDSSEQRIEKLVAEFLDSILACLTLDDVRVRLVSENSDLQPELEERLRFAESILKITGFSKTEADKELTNTASATLPTFVPAEGVVRLDCPHCGNRLNLVDTNCHEVTCGSCGSIITLGEEGQTTRPFQRIPVKIGRFRILSLLGSGGFGTAYLAHDPNLDRNVALKIPRAGEFVTQNEKVRFIREAKNAASLRHDNIVQVHEINTEGDFPYIVSEFIDGMTLADRITGLPIPHAEVARLMILVSDAVHYAHQHSIIHRDLKPSNIFLNTAQNPYVADFGLARNLAGEHTMTMEGEILGTPAFMSPEQATGKLSQITAQSDVYSLGVILYRLLCRENPFRGSGRMMMHQVVNDDPVAPRKIDDRIPIDLETITLKAMDKKQENRYASAKELADDLRRWQNDQAILARPETSLSKFGRWCRKNQRVAGLLTLVWGLLAIVSAISIGWGLREKWLKQQTEILKTLAESNATESQRQLTAADVQHGIRQMELGVFSRSILWFAKALEDTVDDPAVQRLRIGMTLNNHPRLTLVKWAESAVHRLRFSQSGAFALVGTQSNGVLKISTENSLEKSLSMPQGELIIDVRSDVDEERLLSFAKDKPTALLRRFKTGVLVAELQHEVAISAIDFSADGRLIATSDRQGNIKIWDGRSGAFKFEFQHPERRSIQLQFLDNDRLLANSMSLNDVELCKAACWRIGDRASEQLFEFDANIAFIRTDPKSKYLLVAGRTGTLIIRDIESGMANELMLQHTSSLEAAYFIVSRSEIVTLQHDGTITTWAMDGRRKKTSRHRVGVKHSAIDVNQHFIAVAGSDGLVAVYWTYTLQLVGTSLVGDESVSQVAFHPNGRHVLAGGSPGIVRMFDLAGLAPDVPLFEHGGAVNIAKFSPDGERAITASDDHTASIWNAQKGSRIGEPIAHGESVKDCGFDGRGQTAASASLDGSIKIANGQSGNQLGKTIYLSSGVVKLQFSPTNDAVLYAACTDGTVASVNASNSELNFTSNRTKSQITDFQFSPTGEQFIVAATDKSASLRDSRDGALQSPPLLHFDAVSRCGFSWDGSTAWTCSSDQFVRFWKTTSPFDARQLKFNIWPTSVAFDSVGNYAVSTYGGGVTFWRGDQLLWEFENRDYRFKHCQIDSTNRLVMACGFLSVGDEGLEGDGVIVLLDHQSGLPVSPPLNHLASVERTFFDPACSKLLSASLDHSARIWKLTEDDRTEHELRNHAIILSGAEINKSSQAIAVKPARLAELFSESYENSPRYFSCSQDEIERWQKYVEWVIKQYAPL